MALVVCVETTVKVEIAGTMFRAATQVVFGNQDKTPFYHPVPSHGQFLQYDPSYITLEKNESVLIPYPSSFRTYLYPNSTVASLFFVTPDCLTAFLDAGHPRPANLRSTVVALMNKRSLPPHPRRPKKINSQTFPIFPDFSRGSRVHETNVLIPSAMRERIASAASSGVTYGNSACFFLRFAFIVVNMMSIQQDWGSLFFFDRLQRAE
jgi:hypothetical protein